MPNEVRERKQIFMDEGKTKICSLCHETFNPSNELFQKKHQNLCQHCDREEYELEIGFEND